VPNRKMHIGTLKDLRGNLNLVLDGLFDHCVAEIQMRSLEGKIRGNLALEGLLVAEATDEPVLWR